ncbi:hypothetical protein CJ030_MR3G012330 [Morella rubra]|uniref:Myb/SANT-like domain-containing protein n=1 Tax=Morella rubra TaxID=262757 RepID=A0A6A1W2T5_9ROSI|nr:hypothetical protein CJ030_MR3G012330 [Morella rubra]
MQVWPLMALTNRHRSWDFNAVGVLLQEAKSNPPPDSLTGITQLIPKAWFRCIADRINARCNTRLTAVDIRGRYRRLEHEYRKFTALITIEGFFWNKEEGVVLAVESK